MNVIEEIERQRLARGWTKYRLAEEAMLTYSTLSAIYTRHTPPKLDVLEMICTAFGLSLAQFFAQGEEGEILSDDEKSLLKQYRKLSAAKRRALRELLEE